jgi:predicted Zn-dependent peptidase
MFSQFKLKNGVKVILAPMKNTEIVTTLALMPLGSRFEKDMEAGSAHFIEHMLFKGTKNRPTALEISKELDALGANFNAFTSKEHTGYYIGVLKENLKNSLDILADIFFNSLFDSNEIEREKSVILEEIKLYQDNPAYHIYDVFFEMLFDKNSLGRNTAGSPETVKNTTRQKLFSFKEALYQPNNLVLVLAGAIKNTDLKLVEKYFNQKGNGETRNFEKFQAKAHQPKIRIVTREVGQIQLSLGFPAISYLSPDEEALDVLTTALGGNMSSRLFQEVREKRGLAYSISCGYNSFNETGAYMVNAGVDPKNLEQTLKVIVEELNKIKKDGLTQREIDQTKDFLIRKMKMGLEDSSSVANWYGWQKLFLKKVLKPEEKFKKIKKVTAQQIIKIGQMVFDKNQINLAMVGPVKENSSHLSILKNLK